MLNYATATVLTLLFSAYVVCRTILHAHVVFLPETVSPDVPFGL